MAYISIRTKHEAYLSSAKVMRIRTIAILIFFPHPEEPRLSPQAIALQGNAKIITFKTRSRK
jgi:hypothetical protein